MLEQPLQSEGERIRELESNSQPEWGRKPVHLCASERELVWRVFAQNRRSRAERELAALPAHEARDRRRRALPPPPQAAGTVLPLAGIEPSEWLSCMDVLPGGEHAVTLTDAGKLRLSTVADGTLVWEVDAHAECKWFGRNLAVLGDRIVASCGWKDERVRTWDVARGDARGEMQVRGGGVSALAAIDRRRFAVGCEGGEIVFCEHAEGRRLAETARVAAADRHCCRITACAAAGERLASASSDGMVCVWDVETCARVAELRGHNGAVTCVDMSESTVVTGCSKAPHVRVFSAASGYACVSSFGAVEWVHNSWVHSVHVLGRDRVMSVSGDRTMAISAARSREVVARVQLGSYPLSTAVLPDGAVAVCGMGLKAAILPPPAAAAGLLRAYGGSKHGTRLGG